MSESNGKWQIGFWVLTVLVVGSFSWTSLCAYNNQRKIESLFNMHWELKEVANDALHRIDLRLSRIEDKLYIRK
jgi:hypothetical protein